MTTTKKCCTCGLQRPLAEFNRRAKAQDGLQSRCRACCAQWYLEHKADHVRNVSETKRRLREQHLEKYRNHLEEHPCLDCGESDLRVLDFDHRDRSMKRANVGKLIASGYPWKTILLEIAKCDVRCANCHRRRTSGDFAWWRTPAEAARRAAVTGTATARLAALFPPSGAPHPVA